MYSQYGDSQYPHGPELSSIRGQVPVDPSMGHARYPYMSYYGSKGPESAQLAAAAMAQSRPHYGGEYGVMSNPEAMFNQGWPGQGYMGPHSGKPGGPYGMQVSHKILLALHFELCTIIFTTIHKLVHYNNTLLVPYTQGV